jgi:tRNA(fMet)-specific endonuclease VapC
MIYLLDSDTCITYLRNPLSSVAQKLATVTASNVALSAVTAIELVRGAYRSAQVAHNLAQVQAFVAGFPCLPLDLPVAEIAGRVDADLMTRGLRIGPYDTLIAAIALAHNLILVTHNSREFNRVTGLRLEDWETRP